MPLLCIEQVWKEYNIFENVSYDQIVEIYTITSLHEGG